MIGGMDPPAVPVLRGRKVLLRPLRDSDKDDRFEAGRDSEYVRLMGGSVARLQPLTRSEVETAHELWSSRKWFWTIEVYGRAAGFVTFLQLDEDQRQAVLGIGVFSSQQRGQGLGTEAIRLLLRYAFDGLRLHRIGLRVLERNTRAIACYERCGFRREGLERDSALIDGEFHNDVLMGVLEDEYRALLPDWALPEVDQRSWMEKD